VETVVVSLFKDEAASEDDLFLALISSETSGLALILPNEEMLEFEEGGDPTLSVVMDDDLSNVFLSKCMNLDCVESLVVSNSSLYFFKI
jgi:hypothetical protein